MFETRRPYILVGLNHALLQSLDDRLQHTKPVSVRRRIWETSLSEHCLIHVHLDLGPSEQHGRGKRQLIWHEELQVLPFEELNVTAMSKHDVGRSGMRSDGWGEWPRTEPPCGGSTVGDRSPCTRAGD
jgi:hypothetical protein